MLVSCTISILCYTFENLILELRVKKQTKIFYFNDARFYNYLGYNCNILHLLQGGQ